MTRLPGDKKKKKFAGNPFFNQPESYQGFVCCTNKNWRGERGYLLSNHPRLCVWVSALAWKGTPTTPHACLFYQQRMKRDNTVFTYVMFQSIRPKINSWAIGFCLSLGRFLGAERQRPQSSEDSVLPTEMERRHPVQRETLRGLSEQTEEDKGGLLP